MLDIVGTGLAGGLLIAMTAVFAVEVRGRGSFGASVFTLFVLLFMATLFTLCIRMAWIGPFHKMNVTIMPKHTRLADEVTLLGKPIT